MKAEAKIDERQLQITNIRRLIWLKRLIELEGRATF